MNPSGKRVFIVGAGRGQVGLYKACKKIGATAIAAGYPGNYPGLKLADEVCNVDISNPEQVVEAAKKLRIDAAVTSCMDTGVEAVGAVNDALGLCGVSRQPAADAFNKVTQKKAFFDYKVPTAEAVIAKGEENLQEAETRFGYPLVIKRSHSQGSDGVFVAHSYAEAIEIIRSHMISDQEFLLEEFLSGDEFGAQAFISHGDIKFIMPHGDLIFNAHAPIPVGHYVPLQQSNSIRSRAIDAVKKAIIASHFDNCAVNVDLCISKGEIYLFELTARVGANGLPELASMYTGSNYYELIIRNALGEDIAFMPAVQDAVLLVKMVLPKQDGMLGAVDLTPIDDRVVDVWPFKQTGEAVNSFASLKDCLGQISVRGGGAQRKSTSCVRARIPYLWSTPGADHYINLRTLTGGSFIALGAINSLTFVIVFFCVSKNHIVCGW